MNVPYIRKLPSGLYQATVRAPGGQRYTRTDPLRRVVADWARDEENRIARGQWRDPRAGRITVGEWAERWMAARVVEAETRRGDEGAMRMRVVPHWRDWPLASITPLDVQSWVRSMQKSGAGPHAVRRAYNLFATLCRDAVTAELIAESPCRNIARPAAPPKLPAWFTREQVDRIRAQLDVRHRGHSVMTELMCVAGPRWGEAAAACGAPRPDGNPVDWLRGRLRVIGALTQYGRWKEYPKTSKSRREVPVPRYVLDQMAPLLHGRPSDGYVFVTNRGARPLMGANWRVVWYAAIDRANAAGADVPRLDPHDCRHTAASWLAQAGVPLHDIQQLLGHESAQTTARYAHLQPDAFGAVEAAWDRILTRQRRTSRRAGGANPP
ncbi:MAG TPA: tyrosine-type recombinase/integrase [Micromonosporaceae bacterium]|nr:tyrosine-type recombinase/integrase [Micromonosporaceae bacterium]